MSIIDKSAILNGTLDKAFTYAFESMRKYYSKETAKQLYDVYKKASLSFITGRDHAILTEAYYGTDFFINLIKTTIIPPHVLEDLGREVESVVQNAKRENVDEGQIAKYEDLLECIINMLSKVKNTNKLDINYVGWENKRLTEMYFDVLHDAEMSGSKDELKEVLDCMRDIKCPYTFFTIAPLVLSKYPEYSSHIIYEVTKKFYKPYRKDLDAKELSTTLACITSLNFLMDDSYVIKALDMANNVNLKMIWKTIGSLKISDIEDTRIKAVKNEYNNNVKYSVPCCDGLSIVDRVMQESSLTLFEKEERDIARYESLDHKRVILEHVLETSNIFEDLKLTTEQEETCIQELADTEAELIAMEWEDDGEPNAVIKKHIQTKKEKEKEEAEKKGDVDSKEKDDDKKPDSDSDEEKDQDEDSVEESKDDSDEDDNDKESDKDSEEKEEDDEDEDSDKDDKEFTEENEEYRKDLIKKVEDAVSSVEDCEVSIPSDDLKHFKIGESNVITIGQFKKDKFKDVVDSVKDALRDDKNSKVIKEEDLSIVIEIEEDSEFYLEGYESDKIIPSQFSALYEAGEEEPEEDKDTKEPDNDDKVTPQKPKEDLATKIQNKALDHDVEAKQKSAEKKEKRTKLKNALKASTSGQRDLLKKEQSFVQDVDKWDDNRRKKFLIKPGFRHRIFKNMKLALMYGTAAQMKLFYVPVTMVLRHFSKNKDKRIRNELIRELDTEIRICEEKINDANSNGDQQEKYKLMRIKAKLEAEKNRVTVNSKYI